MITPSEQDVTIIRELAARVAEIASLPVQEEKRELWRRLNSLEPARPMVMIDQVCWNEMHISNELTLQCVDPECRGYEQGLRRTLYQWKHFPVDMVVESFVRVPKAIHNTGFGIRVHEQTAISDPANSVVGHKFENQLQAEGDLEKIREPKVSHDSQETERRLTVACELFDGLLEVRPWGADPYLSLWDPSTVSPDMFREFEVEYASRICERFGLVYYGCCEPLDGKMTEVRMIPNVRKVSMSPWVDQERGAAEIGGDFVYSRKPSPALVAMDRFSPRQVRGDLIATRKVCEKNGCPLELILKDISTVRYEPQRIFEWANTAMEVATN